MPDVRSPLRIEVPLRTVSALNVREHPMARHRRVKAERKAVGWSLVAAGVPPDLPVTVRLTRCAPRALDGDNLQGAMKGTRDEIALWLGVDDASPLVTWEYAQEKYAARGECVRIEIEAQRLSPDGGPR